MKIKDIHITPIALSDPPLLNAAGLHQPYALRLVVEIVSDDGISGVSELPGGVRSETALREFAPRLDGHDPFDFNRLDRLLDAHFGDPIDSDPFGAALGGTASRKETNARRRKAHIRSAFEVACYDLIGKALNKRVADLLGGVVRREVPCSAYLFFKYEGAGGELGHTKAPGLRGWEAQRQEEATTPEGIVAEADAMVKAYGFKSIKLRAAPSIPRSRPPRSWRSMTISAPTCRCASIPMRPGRWKPRCAMASRWARPCSTTRIPCAARRRWPKRAGRWASRLPPTCAR
jgi:glucarate dehydratase